MIYDPKMAGALLASEGVDINLRKSLMATSITATHEAMNDNQRTIANMKKELARVEYEYALNQGRAILVEAEIAIIKGETNDVDVSELIVKFNEAVELFNKLDEDSNYDRAYTRMRDVMSFEMWQVNKAVHLTPSTEGL